jgi:rhodanese-related sulfurtransferase
MRKGYKALIADAEAEIETISPEDARRLHAETAVRFVDLRDRREIERDGRIPGAFHCPRGMLEFWIDPESPYHKAIFAEGQKIVFYCASGWRSALGTKTAQDMGLDAVAHIDGGFRAWRDTGGAAEAVS